jgi:hypothetical protein
MLLLVAHAIAFALPSRATSDVEAVSGELAGVNLGEVSAEDAWSPSPEMAATPPLVPVEAVPPRTLADASTTMAEMPSVSQLSVDREDSNGTMSQVTNVSELRDVSPGDWAFEALRSLVERYGCIAGYPDGTYRGNRALTRFEFAAGLNACLQQIEALIVGVDFVTREDLETLERLVSEFEAELATLGTRIDNLEGRVAFLEDNQFSTTTKLSGLTFFHLNGAFADDDVLAEGLDAFRTDPARRDIAGDPFVRRITDDPEVTLSYLTWLNLNTSFTGRDNLNIQLAAGNGSSPANEFVSAGLFNTYGVPFTLQTAGTNTSDVIVREVFYSFPVTDTIQAVVGPRINWYRHFDNNRFTFFLTGANSFNSSGGTQLNTLDRGSGAVVLWDISDKLSLHVGYLGEDTEFLPSPPFNSASNPEEGLFNGTNTLTAELTFTPIDQLNLRFLYTRSNYQVIGGIIGGALSEPIYGLADDGFGGDLEDASADTFSFNFDLFLFDRVGLFGRYAYGSTNLDPANPARDEGEINAQSLQLGVAFPDLGKEGALATVSYLIPFSVLDGRNFLISGGGDGGVQFEVEASYFYPLTPNIAIVPSFYLIGNPNNFSDNPNIYVGNLQAQFSF